MPQPCRRQHVNTAGRTRRRAAGRQLRNTACRHRRPRLLAGSGGMPLSSWAGTAQPCPASPALLAACQAACWVAGRPPTTQAGRSHSLLRCEAGWMMLHRRRIHQCGSHRCSRQPSCFAPPCHRFSQAQPSCPAIKPLAPLSRRCLPIMARLCPGHRSATTCSPRSRHPLAAAACACRRVPLPGRGCRPGACFALAQLPLMQWAARLEQLLPPLGGWLHLAQSRWRARRPGRHRWPGGRRTKQSWRRRWRQRRNGGARWGAAPPALGHQGGWEEQANGRGGMQAHSARQGVLCNTA